MAPRTGIFLCTELAFSLERTEMVICQALGIKETAATRCYLLRCFCKRDQHCHLVGSPGQTSPWEEAAPRAGGEAGAGRDRAPKDGRR